MIIPVSMAELHVFRKYWRGIRYRAYSRWHMGFVFGSVYGLARLAEEAIIGRSYIP